MITPGTTILSVMLAALLAIAPFAQEVRPSGPITSPIPPAQQGNSVFVAPDVDYRIAVGDTLEISVADAPELSQVYAIDTSGTIDMPFLGRLTVDGKTIAELTKFIADRLLKEDYLKSPQVRVIVRQYNSQTYFIQGAIRSPGVYTMAARPSLVKLINLAGGLNENHGPVAIILRPKKLTPAAVSAVEGPPVTPADQAGQTDQSGQADDYELIKVSLGPLFQLGRVQKNFAIMPGDIVHIPSAKVFFITGEVQAPGSFQIREGTTLRQAVALARGLTFKAKPGKGVIFRDDTETGQRREIHVDIGKVMSGKQEDMLIEPNDVIIVPNSRTKSISSLFLMGLGWQISRAPLPGF